jgi:hypothetical protein
MWQEAVRGDFHRAKTAETARLILAGRKIANHGIDTTQ